MHVNEVVVLYITAYSPYMYIVVILYDCYIAPCTSINKLNCTGLQSLMWYYPVACRHIICCDFLIDLL